MAKTFPMDKRNNSVDASLYPKYQTKLKRLLPGTNTFLFCLFISDGEKRFIASTPGVVVVDKENEGSVEDATAV